MPRSHYTHLLPASSELIASFLQANPTKYTQVDFDIKVGQGSDPGDQFEDAIRIMAVQLSQRRIDCIGFTADRIDIIEVTPQAGLTCLGQMIAYPMLYAQTFQPTLPVNAVLIAHEFAPDIQVIFDALDLEYHLIPKPEPVTV